MLCRLLSILIVIGIVFTNATATASAPLTKAKAVKALHKAVGFFRRQVSAKGAYLWKYSADLTRQEGEGKALKSMGWVQPPGTPIVGGAYLNAYELTGDKFYLEAARETAYALVSAQLRSGGWDYRIETDPKRRQRYAYRSDGERAGARNTTTLDDNTTQSALRFLMRVDRTLNFRDKKIHEAAEYALASLLKAQYPNGAWPQRFSQFPDPRDYPVKKAGYPKAWSRTWPRKDYRTYYTFNDNTIADTIATLFEAAAIYDEPKYQASAEKAGGFIILAQMPDPQPAWAQQYDHDMHPAWARKFEPPAVTGGESHGVMRTLMFLYRKTGNKKYLEPIPRAVKYLKKSALPGGKLARFYELKTNKPLFFTKKYVLTYQSDDLPTHYGFIVGSGLKSIEAEYRRLLKTGPDKPRPRGQKRPQRQKPRLSRGLAASAKAVVDRLDKRGAWVDEGRLRYHGADDPATHVIDCRTFVTNVGTLAQFIAASD